METPSNRATAGGGDANTNDNSMLLEDEATARAYNAITAQLATWTSPRVSSKARASSSSNSNNNTWTDVGASPSSRHMMVNNDYDDDDDDGMVLTGPRAAAAAAAGGTRASTDERNADNNNNDTLKAVYKYERNIMDWWNRELVEPPKDNDNDDDDNDDDDEIVPLPGGSLRLTRTPQKASGTKPKQVERSATPIMSNSSRKKTASSRTLQFLLSLGGSAKEQRVMRETNYEEVEPTDYDTTMEVWTPGWVPPRDDTTMEVWTPGWVRPRDRTTTTPHDSSSSSSTITKNRPRRGTTPTPRAISPFRSQQYEYRRYHDALQLFLKARRSLSDRISMEREEAALMMLGDQQQQQLQQDGEDFLMGLQPLDVNVNSNAKSDLVREETRVELEFLRTFKSFCWERDPSTASQGGSGSSGGSDLTSRREGNFWALLTELRQAGLACMLWADDPASMRQNEQAQMAYLETQASNRGATPKELVEALLLSSSNSSTTEVPLVLKRRKHILQWLEHCLEQLISSDTKASVSMAKNNNNNNRRGAGDMGSNATSSSRHLEKVMKSCLSLILAGRLQDARLLLRKAGHSTVAAKFGGGAPAGTDWLVSETVDKIEHVKVGNVNRPLWKRQMWKLSAKMSADSDDHTSNVTPEEAAVHQILANDYHNGLENIALRTWEKGLYVLLYAMWGRTEDELLHLHNNHRRKARPPFPGTQYEQHEREQLQVTSQLTNLSEMGAVEMLAASPFVGMKGMEDPCRASAALLVGRHALLNYVELETQILTDNEASNDIPLEQKISRLRFVTHLLLYLDSLGACTTPVTLAGVENLKNRALFAYVDHLANHEDLWHFLVLYASLMPEEVILDYFPAVLARVQGDRERKMMIDQARDLFPGKGLDLKVMKMVVRLILAEEDDMVSAEEATTTPTRSDVRKMKATQWLYFYEEHVGDALIAANMLLRKFLLDDKFASATMYLQDFLPSALVEKVMTSSVSSTTGDEETEEVIVENEMYRGRIAKARTEHVSFQSYLKAYRAVDEWHLVWNSTPISGESVDDKIDTTALNEPEQAIAKSVEGRELIRQKRKLSQMVVEAAETARRDIMSVLQHDGGWLADGEDEDSSSADNSEEARQRKREIQALRARLLPHIVKLLHEVCTQTADWMWQSLLDASPALGSSAKEVLEALAGENAGQESPLSPRYWTQKALHVAETVSSDEFLVLPAFDARQLKEMLGRMSDIALSDLMYSV